MGCRGKYAPDLLRGDVAPFSGRTSGADITDSMANAAAAHHKPGTLLQWIIATADRAASGFERTKFDEYNADAEGETPQHKNRFQARMISLFEQIKINAQAPVGQFKHAYPLRALGPEAIFLTNALSLSRMKIKQHKPSMPRCGNNFCKHWNLSQSHTAATGRYGWIISIPPG